MVDYTSQEKILVDQCLDFYKKRIHPDDSINKQDPKIHVAAVDYCHSKGELIKTKPAHALMNSILEKNGIEVESNEVRQARLAAERKEVIRGKRVDQAKEDAEKADKIAKKKHEAVDKLEKDAAEAKEKEVTLTEREAIAKKAQSEAEIKLKAHETEIAKLKAELQKKENEKNLAEAAVELEKEEDAEIIPEATTLEELAAELTIKEEEVVSETLEAIPTEETLIVEPEEEILIKESSKEIIVNAPPGINTEEKTEKTIDELIDELNNV